MNQNDSIFATRSTLLVRLKDLDNQRAWQEFFDVYWTLLFNIARRAGYVRLVINAEEKASGPDGSKGKKSVMVSLLLTASIISGVGVSSWGVLSWLKG